MVFSLKSNTCEQSICIVIAREARETLRTSVKIQNPVISIEAWLKMGDGS